MRYWSFLVSFLRRWLGALASAQSHDPKNELDEVNAAAQRGHHGDTGDDCPPTDWLNDLARYGLGGRQTFHGDTIGGDMHFAPPGQIQDAPISKPRTDYADARTSLRTKTAPPSFAATNGRDLPRQNGLSPLRVVPVTENNAPEDLPQTRAPIRPQVIAPTHTPSITAAPTYMPIRQRLHWPQPAWISTVTRSPIANSSTPGPRAATVPMYSWPGVKFLLNGAPPWMRAGGPTEITSRSVAQIATATGRTESAVKSLLHRARATLREVLDIDLDDSLSSGPSQVATRGPLHQTSSPRSTGTSEHRNG